MKTFAFYLPQFHPIPENNAWWGPGFTEWTNVVKCRPRFKGHRQPHLPAELGFYDLRLNEVRDQQAQLARRYGVDGFIYYHYWFNGKRLLETPIENMLKSDTNFPFALCWANENWTRAWDGMDHQVLIEQIYGEDDNEDHVSELKRYFSDPRYIKIEGRPLFLIYRPEKVTQLNDFINRLNRIAAELGYKSAYVLGVKSDNTVIDAAGLEKLSGLVDFQPIASDLVEPKSFVSRVAVLLKKYLPSPLYQRLKIRVSAVKQMSYSAIVDRKISQMAKSSYNYYPCVFPSWDNSARRKSAIIIQNNDPAEFTKWIIYARNYLKSRAQSEQILFVNAWNEWAEGCHLEPDIETGTAFLEALKTGLDTNVN